MNVREAFDDLLKGRSLNAIEAELVIGHVIDDAVPDVVVAGMLVALKLKGENAAELTGGARAMRQRARTLNLYDGHVVDTAGTGGDGVGTFNISTGAALVAATAGVFVAKHGNRAVSGRVGAADVLEYLGVKIDLDPDGLKRCLDQARICFIFAPAYHPALARLAGLRRTLGIRTIFNLIAPLSNPARPRRQLLGVSDMRLMRPMAEALSALGAIHAMVVHGGDGLDEISLASATRIVEVRNGDIREFEITPADFDIAPSSPASLITGGPGEAAKMMQRALAGEPGPAQDILALNAGAAIYVGGGAPSLAAGVELARSILSSGRALDTVEKMRLASLEGPSASE